MSGKHHYLVVKDIEDVIAKHCAEVTFTRAESQASYATLNVTIVYRTKINDMLNKCFGIIMFYISFVLFFFFFLLLADVMKNYFRLFSCIRFWSICKQFCISFLHLLLHSLTELGDFIHSLRESSHYTYLLAIVINNLSDIQILHLT